MKLDTVPHSPQEKRRIIGILKKLPLFAGLHDDEFTHLCDLCSGKSYLSQSFIFKQGDHSRSLFILLSGNIEISIKEAGVVYEASPGDLIGEIGFMTQELRTASTMAMNDCVVMEISKSDYNLLLGQHPRICAIMMQHIAEHLAQHLLRSNNR